MLEPWFPTTPVSTPSLDNGIGSASSSTTPKPPKPAFYDENKASEAPPRRHRASLDVLDSPSLFALHKQGASDMRKLRAHEQFINLPRPRPSPYTRINVGSAVSLSSLPLQYPQPLSFRPLASRTLAHPPVWSLSLWLQPLFCPCHRRSAEPRCALWRLPLLLVALVAIRQPAHPPRQVHSLPAAQHYGSLSWSVIVSRALAVQSAHFCRLPPPSL
jgi:hypothetical protein